MASDDLGDMIVEAQESWARDDDPHVLALPGERSPVVASVGEDDLRVLHGGLVYARRVTPDEVREWVADHDGEARLARLSEFSARFDREDFEEVADDAE